MGAASSVPNGPVGAANQSNPNAVVNENPCQIEFDPRKQDSFQNLDYYGTRRYGSYVRLKSNPEIEKQNAQK